MCENQVYKSICLLIAFMSYRHCRLKSSLLHFLFYRRKKNVYYFYLFVFVTILRILSKKLLMNTSFGYFWRQQSVHVKLELMMFWHEKRFSKLRGFVTFLYNSIKIILLCNSFKCWWAKILLVHIGYCLNWKVISLHVQNHIFWIKCRKRGFKFFVSQNIVYQWYTRFWLLNHAF